jgi:hydrogenase expression/formation protein HypC
MCLAIPAKVLSINGSTATVDMAGNQTVADISLLENVSIGEYIIIHAGMAIQRLDEEEAQITLGLFRELAEKMAEQ